MSLKSCIYRGRLRHRRFVPVTNDFTYRLFMMYLDLEELPTLFKGRPLWSSDRPAIAWFRREDHFGDPTVSMDEAVRGLVAERTGERPSGPIRLLTHLRYFGFCFNPVSFFYCFDPSDSRVETVVAEINNTPWGERHCYVLPESMNQGDERKKQYRFEKQFHVSPFMDMNMSYDWRFVEPGRELVVHMENQECDTRHFDATLTLERHEINASSLMKVLAIHPWMTGKVIAAIHWQALRLWWKKAPFYTHPRYRSSPKEVLPS